MAQMLERRIPGYGTVDCLPMWFYFYMTPIRDPLTILQHTDGDVEIHPGTNRFIGRSIRDDQPWCSARILTIDHPWMHKLEGIRKEQLLDSKEFRYQHKTDFYSNQELFLWSHGGYAPTGNSWLEMPEQWAQERLGEWGGKLVLTNNRTHVINRTASKYHEVSVVNHSGLTEACRNLFTELEKRLTKRPGDDIITI